MGISVVTITHNAVLTIERQLRSVQEHAGGIDFEQIVVDNASTDGTVALIRQKFPSVTVIENKKNIGFGRANNQGVAVASGEFFLFLNPDMQWKEGSLESMVAWMRNHPKVGIASGRLVDERGMFNRAAAPRRFPTLFEMLILLFKLPHVFPGLLNRYLMKDFDPQKEQAVDSVRGSFLFMRRELVQRLGWAFDPRYFIWFEDVDSCREAHRLGFTVVYTPIISCIDLVGQTFKKQNWLWKQGQFWKSTAQYFWKWGV